MEEVTPEQIPQAPERKEEKQLPKFLGQLRSYLTHIGGDVRWYYDVRLYIPVILVLAAVSMCTGTRMGESRAQKTQADLLQSQPQVIDVAPMAAEETQAPTQAPIDPEAEALAILAESVGKGRSKNVKTAIMWVAINRSEDHANGHGLSLIEEIARPEQWQNYDPEMPYSLVTYDMALEVLRIRDTGGLRPLDNDMLWMVLNDDGSITIRNMFAATGGQKWREKTVK